MSDQEQAKDDRGVHQRLRSLPRVIFGAALIALLYWVIYQLPDPRVPLDYLKALVWPVAVMVAAYYIREPLRDKVADVLHLKAGPLEVGFGPGRVLPEAPSIFTDAEPLEAEGAADEDEPVEKVASDDGELKAEEGTSVDGPQGGGPTSEQAELQRKVGAILRRKKRMQDQAAIEDIIRESAAWGYDMAKLGFKTRPTPVIEWTEDGRPIIVYGRGEIGPSITIEDATPRPNDPIRVVEMRIRGLEEAIRGLESRIGFYTPAQGVGERELLSKMKRQLRNLDPESPFGRE